MIIIKRTSYMFHKHVFMYVTNIKPYFVTIVCNYK